LKLLTGDVRFDDSVAMDSATQERLIDAAVRVRMAAHAPYSRFQVGAAVLTGSGDVYAGCNVENASYGLTICAERAAVCAAVAAGHTQMVAVAIATSGGHSPCGACRQVLSEFGPAMEVLLVDADEPQKVRRSSLDKLLPEQFSL
jgi:cytidine deaminase